MKSTRQMSFILSILLLSVGTIFSPAFGADANSQKEIPYFLQKVEFKVTINRGLLTCEITKEMKGRSLVVEPSIMTTVKVEPLFLPDKNAIQTIPIGNLENILKDTTLSVEFYENGTIQAFNSESVDKTGKVISNIFDGLARFAGIFLRSVDAHGVSPESPKPGRCSKDAKETLNKIKGLKTSRERIISAMRIASGAEEKTLKVQLEETEQELAFWSDFVTDEQIKIWGPQNREDTEIPIEPKQKVLTWFINPDLLPMTLRFRLKNQTKEPNNNCPSGDEGKDCMKKGLIFRSPAQAELTICSGKCKEEKDTLYSGWHEIPQWGQIVILPFAESGFFESKALSASFGPSGRLLKFGYRSNAQAEAASEAFSNVAAKVAGIVEARRASDIAKLKAETEKLEAETSKYTAELERNKTKKT